MMKLLAQGQPIDLWDKTKSNLQGFGPLGLETTTATDAPITFAKVLSSTVGLISIIGIIWMVITIITGAVAIISSGGDKNALESAKKKITNGVIGLVVLVTSLFIITLFGRILGIPAILNIANLIKLLN